MGTVVVGGSGVVGADVEVVGGITVVVGRASLVVLGDVTAVTDVVGAIGVVEEADASVVVADAVDSGSELDVDTESPDVVVWAAAVTVLGTGTRGWVTSSRTAPTAWVAIHTESNVATIQAAAPNRFICGSSHRRVPTTLSDG